jgi:trigger factor
VVKSSVEQLNPTRVKLTVEVAFDELKENFDKAYKQLSSQVKVPGFRPGKVPARILDARVGRGTILSEVVNDAIPQKYSQALSDNDLTPLGQPEIEVTNLEDGKALSFTAEVDVRPTLVLPDPSTISVTVDTVEVTDADVDEQVEALRDRFATLTIVDRPAADGDTVSIDLEATAGGEPIADATASDLTYRIGSRDLVDGIDEAVTGLSAGESATFTTTLVAGEFAGQEAEVVVTVNTVKERLLPEVDDEFAAEASKFDTVEEMRADLLETVRLTKNRDQGVDARDAVLDALLAATDVPVPEAVLDAEFENRKHDIIHALDHDDQKFEAWLVHQGKSNEEFEAELRERSTRGVKVQLLLDSLADQAQVNVSQEEFTERILFNAQQAGTTPDEYFKRVQDQNALPMVFAEVRRAKALASAVTQATVTDSAGNVLDVQSLFGFELVDPTAEDIGEDVAAEEIPGEHVDSAEAYDARAELAYAADDEAILASAAHEDSEDAADSEEPAKA